MAQPTSTIEEREASLVKFVDGVQPWRNISEYLVNDADAKDMAVDGSGGSPAVFFYTPPANYNAVINRLSLYLQTSSAMSVAVFGNLAAALGTGIELKSSGVLLVTWQDNIDLYLSLHDVDTLANVSDVAADVTLHGILTFDKDANGQGVILPNGDRFEVIINDDLSTITQLRIRIGGKLTPIIP